MVREETGDARQRGLGEDQAQARPSSCRRQLRISISAKAGLSVTLCDIDMRRHVERLTVADLIARYPKRGKTSGWYFRIDELANGVWRVEGSDQWGRCVSHTGSDPDTVLEECERHAAEINRDTSLT